MSSGVDFESALSNIRLERMNSGELECAGERAIMFAHCPRFATAVLKRQCAQSKKEAAMGVGASSQAILRSQIFSLMSSRNEMPLIFGGQVRNVASLWSGTEYSAWVNDTESRL